MNRRKEEYQTMKNIELLKMCEGGLGEGDEIPKSNYKLNIINHNRIDKLNKYGQPDATSGTNLKNQPLANMFMKIGQTNVGS
mmetsp:Transcript_14511/g.22519  ORF Transcript_14511/g.22519 Transcript_14511/m.22519 type:complete len:82 (+) Transcript_14511:72-317(+)